MNLTSTDYLNILPLLLIGAGILISLTVEMYSKKSEGFLAWFSFLLHLAVAYYSLYTVNNVSSVFGGMMATGGTVNIFYFIFNFGAAIVALLSMDYLKKADIYFGEYYILMQSSVLGMMLMASATDLVMIFIGLELMSICFYVLAGFQRKNLRSNEASLKYFLLGSFATGFIVYGMALIYGSAGSLNIQSLYSMLSGDTTPVLFYVGVLLFVIGFSFKIAAFPFHMWVPDVYQGAPTSVTAMMSTIGKAAAFSALLLIMIPFIGSKNPQVFSPLFTVLSAASMIFGSIVALAQTDIKRMLAYSSIAHAGYMLIGLAAGNDTGTSGIMFYLAAYAFMNLGAFGIVSLIERKGDTEDSIDSYAGLSDRNPLLAGLLALFMFTLSGLPPFAGFFGKYYVFIASLEAGNVWLAILGALSSAISAYFYLRIIVVMYFRKSEPEANEIITESHTALLGIVISAILVIMMGLAPGSIVRLINSF
ncbi:MAG: NADH-quinone oxidoreductase subunit N [Ignavibacteriaceae bacterium]|nr:NADH-quinone oxidoreductase subunit N [Ignavibacteriaceae bacterium]